MDISLDRIQKVECLITQDNFDSVVRALEAAFPLLRPFREVLAYSATFIIPEQMDVSQALLEHVITSWQQETERQMVGSFSMPIGPLLGRPASDDDGGPTVSFEPHLGDPEKLCKLKLFYRADGPTCSASIEIELASSKDARLTKIMTFAAEVEAFTLTVTLDDGEIHEVAPGELL